MATIVICDKSQRRDHISLGNNTASLPGSETFVLANDGPQTVTQ